MSGPVALSWDDNLAIITIDNPPVNALSPGVPEGILAALDAARNVPGLAAVVLMGAGKTFIAGADIHEFGKITSGERPPLSLEPTLSALEDFPRPVVAAIHGSALGGGLEVAMACHYRIALASAQVGQPEVKIGLIPGAGGTQRLPRLVGVQRALEMCVAGDPVRAPQALEYGVLDRVVDDDLRTAAVAFAREQNSPRRTRDRNDRLGDAESNAPLFAAARQSAAQRYRHRIAPLKAIDAIEGATRLPFEEGLKEEARLFRECLFSDQSKALIHAFFGEREVSRPPGLKRDVSPRPVRRAAVVGAGTMGGGIAMCFANAGIPVILKETDATALERGVNTIRRNYASSVRKGRFPQEVMDRRMALIQPTLTFEGFDQVDIVVEAVFEGLPLKQEVFAELDRVTAPGTVLATNTSTLDIDRIASVTSRPEWVIGTHFFSPANVMRLLEVVRGSATSPEVIATAMALAKPLGKVAVLVGNCFGFVGNRMFGPYRREAQFLVEEGVSPEAVDSALVDFGMALGPLAVGDLAGLDVGWRIRKEHPDPIGMRTPRIEDLICEHGYFGQKTGAGWYRYIEGKGVGIADQTRELIAQVRRERGEPLRDIDNLEIVDRCLLALVNEAARILEDGIASRAVEIDMIYLLGYGFPNWRGGPLWWADQRGLDTVLARIQEFAAQFGSAWEPAPLLRHLAQVGSTFGQWTGKSDKTGGNSD